MPRGDRGLQDALLLGEDLQRGHPDLLALRCFAECVRPVGERPQPRLVAPFDI